MPGLKVTFCAMTQGTGACMCTSVAGRDEIYKLGGLCEEHKTCAPFSASSVEE